MRASDAFGNATTSRFSGFGAEGQPGPGLAVRAVCSLIAAFSAAVTSGNPLLIDDMSSLTWRPTAGDRKGTGLWVIYPETQFQIDRAISKPF